MDRLKKKDSIQYETLKKLFRHFVFIDITGRSKLFYPMGSEALICTKILETNKRIIPASSSLKNSIKMKGKGGGVKSVCGEASADEDFLSVDQFLGNHTGPAKHGKTSILKFLWCGAPRIQIHLQGQGQEGQNQHLLGSILP